MNQNPLGLQTQRGDSVFGSMVVATKPRSIKLINVRPRPIAAIWRRLVPDGVLVYREAFPPTGDLSDADARIATTIAHAAELAPHGPVFVEAPWCGDMLNGDAVDTLAAGSTRFADACIDAGMIPIVLIYYEGNPADNRDLARPSVLALLRHVVDRIGFVVIGPQAYTVPPLGPTDPDHVLRYRQWFALWPPEIVDRCLVIVPECGIDGGVNPGGGAPKPGQGFRGFGISPLAYGRDWLLPLARELAADPHVIAAEVFGCAMSTPWNDPATGFDIEDSVDLRAAFTTPIEGPPRIAWAWPPKEGTHDRRDPGQVPGPDPDAAAGAAGGVRPPADGAGDAGEPGTQGGGVHAGLPQEGRMSPWSGKGCIVRSNAVASWSEVIAMAHALGLDYLDLQVGNGAGSWVGSHVTRELVDQLKNEGFRVTGWLYDYDDLAGPRYYPKDGIPEEEAANVVGVVRALGLDGFTSDLEDEPEGHGDLVSIFLAAVRAGLPGVPLAAFTWADLHGHERYPMDVISTAVDCLRPMCYAPVWRAPRMIASLWPYLVGRDWAPAWGVTEATRPELVEDFATADHAGDNRPDMRAPIGESYWEATALIARQAELGAILKARFPLPAMTPAPAAPPSNAPVAVPAEVTAALDALWAAAGADVEKQNAIIKVKIAFGLQEAA